jgi:methyl-galactoside transport system ATP-binding protein
MEEILTISDEITVMRDGRHVATEASSSLDMDTVIRLMVGRTLENRYPAKTNRPGEPILEVRGLQARYNPVRDVSFALRRGEILGVAGLAGAGRSGLLETLYGLAVRDGGESIKEGQAIENRTPRQAIRNGFALLTEERRATGIFGVLSIRENTTVASLSRYLSGGFFLNEGKRQRATEQMIRSMQIKTPTQRTQIRTLSGGNQQKVILGRWLLTEPDILLLDEPTRGIDIGAKYEIYRLMIELAEQGKGIMMVSSEMPELLGVCDRILVLSGGRLAGEVNAADTNQEQIMTLAARYV